MNIFITLDYELFFGNQSGTVAKCIIQPTNDLIKILDQYNIKISFFVDSGYLLALEKFKTIQPELESDYQKLSDQIRKLAQEGHGIELHVHPHWEDSFYDGNSWIFNTRRYKLSDFSEQETLEIVSRHCDILFRISGKHPVAYRAGGWSVQPFPPIGRALNKNGILIDSSVFPKGYYDSPNQKFDFRKAPRYITEYKFEHDPSIPLEHGTFSEIPISSYKVLPSFFWNFALKKFTNDNKHQSYGDGYAIKMPYASKLRLLTSSSYSVVSMDGFKASLLKKSFDLYCKKTSPNDHFVIIGHPKAFTPYGLDTFKTFVDNTVKENEYLTFRKLIQID